MKTLVQRQAFAWWLSILALVLVATACGRSALDTPTAMPTVDTGAIIDAVLAKVEAQMAAQAVTPEATLDPNQIREAVLEEVDVRLAAQAVTPIPTLDTVELREGVLTEVEALLAERATTPVPTVDPIEIADAVLEKVEPELEQLRDTVSVVSENAATALAGANMEDALINLYKQANPAVVFIIVPLAGSSGSGFVYSSDGHIVTNNHVVAAGTDFEVVFADGQRRSAELVGADVDSDLAVIQVDDLPDGIEPLPLAAPEDADVGQFVVAIGNPFGEQGSMSLGIISGLGRSLPSERADTSGSYSLPRVIQTDAPINPGNSGGPLLNLSGEVIGVNSAIATRTGTNSGVGFSIPVAAVRQIVPSLVLNGEYDYPYMGAGFTSELTLDDQSAFGLPQANGAYVINLIPGSPAAVAGLIAADHNTGRGGDLIVKIDDQEINDFADLNGYLVFHTKVGQTIEINVLRDGELMVVPLTLGSRP